MLRKIMTSNHKMLKLYRFIASLGPIGNFPASGTWGSIVALPFVWFLTGTWGILFLTALSFLLGVFVIRPLIKGQSEKDPSFVIIDEFMGQMAVFCFFPQNTITPIALIFGFFFFRLFDILKPWPASFFDKKVHTGFGVMMDDLVAALYATISLAFMEIISYYL